MKTKRTNKLAALVLVALMALFLIGLPMGCTTDIYVTKAGSPDPDGSLTKPYQMIEAGIFRANSFPGSTVRIEGGKKYYETFTADTACTLKSTGGTVTIGKMDYKASTTLDIITLNTHLFGDVIGPSWKDKARAYDIAIQLRDMGPDKPDIVGFQEIWDEDLFRGGDGVTLGIRRRSGYDYGKHGKETRCTTCANSGLAIMSRWYPVGPNWLQEFWTLYSDPRRYDYCNGFAECHSSKGWVQTEIEKDDFRIWVLNLHTQAGESLADRQVRKNQLTKLRAHLIDLRDAFPGHVFFVMGDFNIYDHKDQYRKHLINILGDEEAGGKDADRNSPGFIIGCTNDCKHWTCSRENPLAIHWDEDTESGRLDYIFYFPPLDGSIEVLPIDVSVVRFTGREIPAVCRACLWPECDPAELICQEKTTYSSDHWGVHGKFKLIRIR